MTHKITDAMEKHLEFIKELYIDDEKIYKLYENGLKNTYETTLKPKSDGKTFVITGDIPAMWLRDSAAQVRTLLLFTKEDLYLYDLIAGVVKQQVEQIKIDPYANAFNDGATGEGHQDDVTQMKPELWERKYEIDSLCYPVQLAYLLWKNSGKTLHFDGGFRETCYTIIETFRTEQYHAEKSTYKFERDEDEEDRVVYETLQYEGKGTPIKYTGMTWSGFRPSDDACSYGYLVPANMFAVVILRYMAEIAENVYEDDKLKNMALCIANEIDEGIKKHAIIKHKIYGDVYAYEVDGLGNYVLMDDANVPSLLSIPYLGYADINDEIYQNTRRMILSKCNPFYFEGDVLKGIGSPHTPKNYVWPIALAIQGMTSIDKDESDEIFEMFKVIDADTNLMHEGVFVDNPNVYTRPWFSWANSLFAEYILSRNNIYIKGNPLDSIIK